MPIKYDETFEIITPESAEHGDFEETGFYAEGCTIDTFANLIDMLANTEPSCYPLPHDGAGVWYTQYGEPDYRTGDTENRAYHPSGERAQRYFAKAWRVSNS